MSSPESSAHRLVHDPAFPALKTHLIQATGLAYYNDKDGDLAVRIARRLAALGLNDCTSYLALLTDGVRGPSELDALIEDLTIGETFFFRHREIFDALRSTVFPALIERNQQSRQLRIWSAGCSTGAEPYSVSILLRRELAQQTAGWDISIVGTDINREFLARAHAGRFEEWAFRTTPEELRRACFTRSGNSWLLAPEYKEGVSFQYHNLVTHPFPSLLNNLFAFDLILCRNVAIYFSLEIIRRILEHFHQCLVEDGWLVVGHAEPNLELFRSFRTVNVPGAVLYQKGKEPASVPAWQPPFLAPQSQPAPPVPTRLPPAPVWTPKIPAGRPGERGRPLGRKEAPRPATPPPATPLQPASTPLETIRGLADRGDLEQAAQYCKTLLETEKLNPTAYFYYSLVLEQMGRHAETEHALRRAIYLDRKFVLAHYYLGLLFQKTERLEQAARSFQNVLQILSQTSADRVYADGDGITAAELKKLAQMNLEIVEGA